MKLMQTRVPEIAHRRAVKLSATDGISAAAWLRRVILVATQDSPAGRLVRRKVAEALAGESACPS
jgi:hypothetical protein